MSVQTLPRPLAQALGRLWDQVTLFLPLGVMVVLAMGSWWLVRSMPLIRDEAGPRPVRTEPDYTLGRFSTEVFDLQGRRVRQIQGEQAQHLPDLEALKIEQVRLWAWNEQGDQLQVQARQGLANDDGDQVLLLGQVHALRPARAQRPSLELRGERVLALQKQERLRSEDPVQIWRGADRFEGQRMDFDMKSGQYELQGRVRALIHPRASR